MEIIKDKNVRKINKYARMLSIMEDFSHIGLGNLFMEKGFRKNMNELVSVIIPTYKGAKKLSRAIDSVLQSTYKNIEIIVVDDNNPDSAERKETEAVISSYSDKNLKYIKHEINKNGAAARNSGINIAKGHYIAFLDDDDYFTPNRIELAVSILKREKKDTFFSNVCVVRKGIDMKIICLPKNIVAKDLLLNDKVIGSGSNLFFEANLAKKLGGFDETFERYQDREFVMRLCKIGKIYISDEALVIKSKNGQNNIPNFYKMKTIEEKFRNKFKEDFVRLSDEEKKQYLSKKNHMLFELAFDIQDKNAMKEVYSELKKINDIHIYEIIVYALVRIGVVNASVVKKIFVYIVCKVRNLVTQRVVKRNLDLWNFIKKMEND